MHNYPKIGVVSERDSEITISDRVANLVLCLQRLRPEEAEEIANHIPPEALSNPQNKWWEHMGEVGTVLCDLYDILNEVCAPCMWFGENERGDAGFWPDMDSVAVGLVSGEVKRVYDPSELESLEEGCTQAVYLNDHGNVSFYERVDGEWNMVWDCV